MTRALSIPPDAAARMMMLANESSKTTPIGDTETGELVESSGSNGRVSADELEDAAKPLTESD